MDETKALAIVWALADGVNPQTGEIFPADSAYQTAEVARALFLAGRALETKAKARLRPHLPANAGRRWTEEEDRKLLAEFDSGCPVSDLAPAHGRTVAGIQARLEKYGRLQMALQGQGGGNGRVWRSANQRVEVS